MRLVGAAAVLLVTTLACAMGGQSAGGGGTVPQNGGWIQVAPPEAGFSVQMPVQPAIRSEQRVDADGAPFQTVIATGQTATMLYGVAVFDSTAGLTGDLHVMLDQVSNAFNENIPGRVRHAHTGNHEGFPVREVIVDLSEGVVMVQRHYVGLRRVYTFVTAYAGATEAQNGPSARYFMESVRLDGQDAPSPNGDGRLATDDGSWRYVYPPEADFAVMMPGTARTTQAHLSLEQESRSANVYSVTSPDGAASVTVIAVDFDGRPPPGVLDQMQQRMEGTGFGVRKTDDVVLQGFAGRELVLDNAESVIHARLYVTNARLYEVRVTTSRDGEAGMADARQRFFDSFRIL